MQHDHQPPVDVQGSHPDWEGLRRAGAGQAGHFTSAQAAERGFSNQLLSKHVAAGNLERPLRGIYRLAHFPPMDNEDLVVAVLWAGPESAISHESALQLHALSDALPSRIHLTLPESGRVRRRVVPPAYSLHHADLGADDTNWVGPVRVTTPARTVQDVAAASGDAALVEQAVEQGIRRNLFHAHQVAEAVAYVAGFRLPIGATRVFADAVADLPDGWVYRDFTGRCTRALPADWPALARSVLQAHGGRLYVQHRASTKGRVLLTAVWPCPGPDATVKANVQRALAERLLWR